ncbi:MAG: YitT family protein, partial [Clostridiales bacterium]
MAKKKKSREQVPPKYPVKKHVRNMIWITCGSLIGCISYLMFVSPNQLLAGGVWGVAAILNHYLPMIPMGVFLVVLNVPLLIWGWKKLKLRFAIYTIYAIILQSALLVVLIPYVPIYTDNVLLACLFGGAFGGVGAGLIVRWHGSGGGTDIVGILLKEKYDISIGTLSFGVNVVVVSVAALVFGFELAMYTVVEMFVCTTVFNRVLEGMNHKRNVMIVSIRGQEIAKRLMKEIGRGVTLMKGEGAYTRTTKDVLFCVVSRFELSALKEIIRDADPGAFVCINETYEVMGQFSKNVQEQNAAMKKVLAI